MDLTEAFLNWQTGLVCVVVYILTQMTKKVALNAKPALDTNHWWKEVVMPAIPVVLGVVCVLLAFGFPFPELIKGWAVKVMYGAACGFFSERVYTFVSKIVDGLKPPAPSKDPT